MLTIDDLNLDKKLSIGIALSFSSDVLPLFEAELPDDLRPREAIESAIKWLSNPSKEASDAAHAAYYAAAAANAARVAAADKDKYIHDRIEKLLPLIIEYKIENKQSFNNAEKVLESLSDEDKVSFLFNLDVLR